MFSRWLWIPFMTPILCISQLTSAFILTQFPAENKSTEHKPHAVTELQLFDEVFPELVTELTDKGIPDQDVQDAMTWFKRVNYVLLSVC